MGNYNSVLREWSLPISVSCMSAMTTILGSREGTMEHREAAQVYVVGACGRGC